MCSPAPSTASQSLTQQMELAAECIGHLKDKVPLVAFCVSLIVSEGHEKTKSVNELIY